MTSSKEKGFTLIQLMIVVGSIAILAAIAMPAYQDHVVRSRVSEAFALASGLKAGIVVNASEGATNLAANARLMQPSDGSANVASAAVDAISGAIPIATVARAGNGTIVMTPSGGRGDHPEWGHLLGLHIHARAKVPAK